MNWLFTQWYSEIKKLSKLNVCAVCVSPKKCWTALISKQKVLNQNKIKWNRMREEKSIKKKKREKANIETKGIIIPKEQNCAVPMQYKDAYVTSTWMDGIVL